MGIVLTQTEDYASIADVPNKTIKEFADAKGISEEIAEKYFNHNPSIYFTFLLQNKRKTRLFSR
jgi:DNA primase